LQVQRSHESAHLLGDSHPPVVYAVHSFHFVPEQQEHVLATYAYDDATLVAAVARENIIGLQFHPEKSGEQGLHIMNRFMQL